MIYGIIAGDSLVDSCQEVKLVSGNGIDGFLDCFLYSDKNIEEKFSQLWNDFFPNLVKPFYVKSGFSVEKNVPGYEHIKKNLEPDKNGEIKDERKKLYESEMGERFNQFKSLYLAIFCSVVQTNKIYFITGDIDFNKKTVKEVDSISQKFQIVKKTINKYKEKFDIKKCEFIYISSTIQSFNETEIKIKHFPVNTSLSDILYYLQNSTVIREEDRHVYAKIINQELTENRDMLKQLEFYFSGDESSNLLFNASIFQTIDSLITNKSHFSLDFYHIRNYASEQRINGNKDNPQWINNYIKNNKIDYTKMNPINDKISLFVSNLQPQFRMFIDTILRNNSTVTIRNYETDNICFYNKGYENSAIKIQYIDGSACICYSDISEDKKRAVYVYKIQASNKVNDEVQQFYSIEKLFKLNASESKTSSNYPHWVLIGFPATGKTETAKFFARMEHLDDNNLESSKIISSDDRINNRTFSDSTDSKVFRSKSDFANPSREEAKNYVAKRHNQKDLEIYSNIEYTARNRVVETSINLSYILELPCDLGSKEILAPSVRQALFMKNFKSILILNAKKPFVEIDFQNAKARIPTLSENTWECLKNNLLEIKKEENSDLFARMSDNAFDWYFKDVFDNHPELADKAARRNIYGYKSESLDNICTYNCPHKEFGCNNKCEYWTNENKLKFKNLIKKEIWDKRFSYYLDYCQYFIVRKTTIKETADAINDIVKSPMYGKCKPEPQLPYYNNESNSFASFTVQQRFSQIWDSAFEDLPWSVFINEHKVSDYLRNTRGPLKNKLLRCSNKSLKEYFKEAEFLQSEFFLYHIMNEEWKRSGKNRFELFLDRKEKDWNDKENTYLRKRLEEIIYQTSSIRKDVVNQYLHLITCGNSHDLSQKSDYNPTDDIQYIHCDIFNDAEKIKTKYIDEDENIYNFLTKRKYSRFDILSDNAGVELFNDCLFAWYLLQTNTVEKLVIHVKPYPMFVSDATKKDFEKLKKIIKDYDETIYTMLTQYEIKNKSNPYGEGRLVIQSDEEDFYVPEFKDCNYIQNIMKAGCELLIVKGDLNYRRLVGDLHWSWKQPIKPIIAQFVTCRCLCLRCIKSDVLLGLNETEVNSVSRIPRKELTSGKYATIQFI